jgi:hypothetical protein
MIWLTWRQFRAPFAVATTLLAAACVWLALTGPEISRLAQSSTDVYDLLSASQRFLFDGGIAVLAVAPALLGIFWGAPLVARELETGTFRLVWSQSVTRRRWLATKLGLTVLAVAVVLGVLSFAITWWAQPLDGAMGSQRGSLASRMTPIAFGMRGVVPVGYCIFALVLGTLVGLVVRRTLTAMAITLALYVVVQVAVPLWVRPYLAAPVDRTEVISGETFTGIGAEGSGPTRITLSAKSPGAWMLTNQTVDAEGRPVELPSWFLSCASAPSGAVDSGSSPPASSSLTALEGCLTRLHADGYRQQLVYHPADDFWRLQWSELGIYLAASGLLAGASFWSLRRRLS